MTDEELSLSGVPSEASYRLLKMREKRIKLIRELEDLNESTVFVFWNQEGLHWQDFFSLADMLELEAPSRHIDLIVQSPGGNGPAGYRIGRTFQKWTQAKAARFRVLIPFYAMSAATILALGADELVMGLTSQIGPIDPQIPDEEDYETYVPALAVLDGLKIISEYVESIPAMSRVFEEILQQEPLTLMNFGVVERMRESGKQYAEALLAGGMVRDREQARKIAERLTDFYKYHGHPIDAFEAKEELNLNVKYCEGNEWKLIGNLHQEYESFVGRPELMPGLLVTTAIETANYREWRIVNLKESSASPQTHSLKSLLQNGSFRAIQPPFKNG